MFCYFFGILCDMSGMEETKGEFLFSLCLIIFHPIFAWNDAIMVFFNFSNFVAIFLKFSITRQVRTKRYDNFYFLSVSWFSNRFWIGIKPRWYFLIFFNFIAIFLEFSIMRRVRTERNDNFYFVSFLGFLTYFG